MMLCYVIDVITCTALNYVGGADFVRETRLVGCLTLSLERTTGLWQTRGNVM